MLNSYLTSLPAFSGVFSIRTLGCILAGIGFLNMACQSVPLQDEPGRPPRFNFAGIHRIPIAYGDGVCPVSTSHSHGYPATPAVAFEKTEQGAKDTAVFFAFFDPHEHYERTCFREGWHLHLRTAQTKNMIFDDELNAFRTEKSLFKKADK